MAKVGARVHIFGDYDGTGVKNAQRDIGAFGQQAQGFSKSFSKSMLGAGAALGGAFAVTAVAGNVLQFFGDSMAAALADEKAMRSLEIALQNVGAAHKVGPVESFIDALARETGVADDQLRPAFQNLVTATGDVALSQKNLQLAMDISAGTGRDLEAVSLALAKGFSGSTTALGKLGAGIDANIIKSKDMDAITAALSAKFAGQAAAAAETYQGRLNRVSVAAGEASEQIGYALLNAVDGLATSMGGADGAAGAVTQLGNGLAGLITQTSQLIDLLVKKEDATKDATAQDKYSQQMYRNIAGAIPYVGFALNILSQYQEGQARAAGLAADANLVLSSRLRGLADDYLATANAANIYGRYVAAPDGKDWANFYAVNQSSQKALGDAQNNVNELTEKYNESLLKLTGGSDSAAKATDTLTKAQERNAEKVADQKTKTDAAIQTFTDYRDSVAQSFSGMLDLSAAFETFTERQTNLATAQKALTDFQSKIVGDATESQVADLAKLQTAYQDASAAAASGSQSVVEEFEAQGRKLQEFGSNLSKLVANGLGSRAFNAIRSMSAERGAEVAASLASGMIHENVARVNSVYDSVNAMALNVGNQAALAFERVGLLMAKTMIETMLVTINGKGRARLKAMIDDLNVAMNAAATGAPMPASVSGGDLSGQFEAGRFTASGIPQIGPIDFAALSQLTDAQIFGRAEGGPVIAGRSYVVGEVGPELFTPSTSGNITPNSAMGGNTYQITVQAGVGDPRAIGQQIVEYVKKFEKANGPVFVAA